MGSSPMSSANKRVRKNVPSKGARFYRASLLPEALRKSGEKNLVRCFHKGVFKTLHGKCVKVFIAIGGMI